MEKFCLRSTTQKATWSSLRRSKAAQATPLPTFGAFEGSAGSCLYHVLPPHTPRHFFSARRCGCGWVVVTDSKKKCWLRVHSLGAHYSVAGLAPWYMIEVSYMLFLLGFTRCSSIVQVLAINNCSIWEIVEQMKFTIRFSTNSAHNNNCRGVRA